MNPTAAWQTEAREIAAAFRLGAGLQAGEPLTRLLGKLAQALGNSPSEMNVDLTRILAALLACHKNSDWLGVADYLEFELIDWLGSFHADGGA